MFSLKETPGIKLGSCRAVAEVPEQQNEINQRKPGNKYPRALGAF